MNNSKIPSKKALCILAFIVLLVSNLFFFWKSPYYLSIRKALGTSIGEKTDWGEICWTKSLKDLNDSVDVAFFGHSIIHFGEFAEAFPNKKIVNLGYSGQDIMHMKKRVEQLSYVHPKQIFIMAGINTIGRISDEDMEKEFKEMIVSIEQQCPSSQLYVFDILPIQENTFDFRKRKVTNQRIELFNQKIKSLCHELGITFVPISNLYKDQYGNLDAKFTDDGCHLKKDSYLSWYESIKELIDIKNL